MVELSGNLTVSNVQDKRASYIGCSAARQAQINTAASNAQRYAGTSYAYIQRISSGTNRYNTWFGAYTTPRKSIVQRHFRLISGRRFSNFIYDCSTCTEPAVYAYVCAYISQSWDCRSDTDRPFDQMPTHSERSICAVLSGPPPPSVPIPRPEHLSTSPPTSPSTVAPRIMFTVSLAAGPWLSTNRLRPSPTPTIMSTSPRTTPSYRKSYFLEPWVICQNCVHNVVDLPTMMYALHVEMQHEPTYVTIRGSRPQPHHSRR